MEQYSLDKRRSHCRRARRALNLTQADLAKIAGVDQSLISHFERGDSDISPIVYARIYTELVSALSKQPSKVALIDLKKDAVIGGWIKDSEMGKVRNRRDLWVKIIANSAREWVATLDDVVNDKIAPESVSEMIKESEWRALDAYSTALKLVSDVIEGWQEEIKTAMQSKPKP